MLGLEKRIVYYCRYFNDLLSEFTLRNEILFLIALTHTHTHTHTESKNSRLHTDSAESHKNFQHALRVIFVCGNSATRRRDQRDFDDGDNALARWNEDEKEIWI